MSSAGLGRRICIVPTLMSFRVLTEYLGSNRWKGQKRGILEILSTKERAAYVAELCKRRFCKIGLGWKIQSVSPRKFTIIRPSSVEPPLAMKFGSGMHCSYSYVCFFARRW